MYKTVLDTETTRFVLSEAKPKKESPLPYFRENKLVSVQAKFIDSEEKVFYPFYHKEFDGDISYNFKIIQQILDSTELLIGHNLKFDLAWLRECGFKYDGKIWDTMIFEYVCAKGLKPDLALEDCAIKYNLPHMKSDILSDYWDKDVNTDGVPLAELTEYGLKDLDVTEALYKHQLARLESNEEVQYMYKAIQLMNDFLPVLTDMERNGIAIDLEELDRLEKEYTKEHSDILYGMKEITKEVMGDYPYNLSSPEQLSQVLYGFKVKDKKLWAETFNLGKELRNGVEKKKYPKYYSEYQLEYIIKNNTLPVFKTTAEQCQECFGKGFFRKTKKDGTEFKKETKCKPCDGTGIIYKETEEKAGFRIKNPGSFHASVGGFGGSKDVIELILERAREYKRNNKRMQLCLDFLNGLNRVGSLENYLNSFIKGIKLNTIDGLLHTNFNQCVTATGRLSSTNPNFQNLPRAGTFPLRKVIKSRFEDGYILSADLSQLEFRIAAFLSQCEAAIQFIKDGRDIHTVSAKYYNIDRQAAKAETFGPLYGKRNEYANHFYKQFPGIKKWHDKLCEEALNNKQTRSPSGRIYAYPFVKRISAELVKPFTQIANYPVQGFATGDITPMILIHMDKLIKERNLESLIVLTVHDDITCDVPGHEKEAMIDVYKTAFASISADLKERFNIDLNVPIDYELSVGKNWLEKNKINLRKCA